MSKSKSNVKVDFVAPILVLTLICLVCSAILAYTNKVTAPIIEATEASIAAAARKEGSGSPRPGSARRAARHCALPAPPQRKPLALRPPRHTAVSAPPPA